jgi:putative phosphoribosyl transferase
MPFQDRAEAGRRLAALLVERGLSTQDAVVLGLPRGGVPVAFEVAQALGLPLDVILVRKLGVPFQPELAMGAIGEGGVRIQNDEVLRSAGIDVQVFAQVEQREQVELGRRAQRYRGGGPHSDLRGRTALIVDDGIATGSTALAACAVARAQGAARVVMAAPVASRSAVSDLAGICDEVVALETPEWFYGVGEWYRDFSQTSDDEVVDFLKLGASRTTISGVTAMADDALPVRDEEIEVAAGTVRLAGHLTVPEVVKGIVIFAHGSGSSRHSSRNRKVAVSLNQAGFGTLLFDLLTTDEEIDRAQVFDIRLLAERLGEVTTWVQAQPETSSVNIGYFGASTGAAAALWAAAEPGSGIAAVVSRGGRPDLAGPMLSAVRAPTLLIVGGDDQVVLELNRQAQKQLRCHNRLAVVPGATHLFEEPGALEVVGSLAGQWFLAHLPLTIGTPG